MMRSVREMRDLIKQLLLGLLKPGPRGALLLVLAICAYKYYKNKQIKVYCQLTDANAAILTALQRRITGYSPTFYLPFSFLKSALHAEWKLSFFDVYLRHELTLSDQQTIFLDWYPRNFKKMYPNTPVVFFVPGVFGTSEDVYCLKLCKELHQRLGWRSLILNRRLFLDRFKGPRFISYFNYSDWREVLEYVQSTFPQADIYMVGVSMGALNIQKYLISFKNDPKVRAAVTISSPFDAGSSSDVIMKNYFLNKVILEYQLKTFRQHLHNEEFLEYLEKKGIDPEAVLKSKTNREFDQNCSIKDLELATPKDYYDRLSSHSSIHDISIPILSINSEDDILIPPANVPLEAIKQNPNIIQLMVAGGGHIEYLHGWKQDYWAYQIAVDYLCHLHLYGPATPKPSLRTLAAHG